MALINDPGTLAGSARKLIEPRTFMGMESSVSLPCSCMYGLVGCPRSMGYLSTYLVFIFTRLLHLGLFEHSYIINGLYIFVVFNFRSNGFETFESVENSFFYLCTLWWKHNIIHIKSLLPFFHAVIIFRFLDRTWKYVLCASHCDDEYIRPQLVEKSSFVGIKILNSLNSFQYYAAVFTVHCMQSLLPQGNVYMRAIASFSCCYYRWRVGDLCFR